MSDVAEHVSDDLTAVTVLLSVYGLVTSGPDRLAVQPFIARTLTYYAARTESRLSLLNAAIARTQRPGLAALGNSLRNDVRRVQQTLESITLR